MMLSAVVVGMLVAALIFTNTVVAEIRNSRIVTQALFFVDRFEFEEASGRVELKVTDISFSTPIQNSDFNLSQIGFFLARKHFFLPPTLCLLHSSDTKYLVYTFDKLNTGATAFNFIFSDINITNTKSIFEENYILYFQNCIYLDNHDFFVTMNVKSLMYNLNSVNGLPMYASPTDFTLTFYVYPTLFIINSIFGFLWAIAIQKHQLNICFIHYVMLLVPMLRAFGLMIKIILPLYLLFNDECASAHCFTALLFTFISDLSSWAPLITVALLICTGVPCFKPSLLPNDKKFLTSVIAIHFVVGFLRILYEYSWPFTAEFIYMYPGFFYQLGIGLGLVFLFATARSSRDSLRERLGAYGKNSDSTTKFIHLFDKLIFDLVDSYFLFIVLVVLLDIFSPYILLAVLLKEMATIVLYASFGYILWRGRLNWFQLCKSNSFLTVHDLEKASEAL